jgi:hypothetical protein
MTEPTPEATGTDESPEDEVTTLEATEDDDGDTFDRAYVQKLRDENAKLRVRAKEVDEHSDRADALAQRLHRALVEADGRLLDPRDLPYRPEHLEGDALAEAISALIEDRPTLANRRPKGDAGQGNRGTQEEPISILGILKNRS